MINEVNVAFIVELNVRLQCVLTMFYETCREIRYSIYSRYFETFSNLKLMFDLLKILW